MEPLQKIDKEMLKACESARFNKVQEYIEKGAQVDAEDLGKWTALNWAVAYQDIPMCSFLLDKGASINHQVGTGRTIFSHAVTGGNVPLINLLMQRGADKQLPDTTGCTPLMYAVMNQDAAVVQLLLENGGRITDQDKNGKTVLEYAQESTIDVQLLVHDTWKKFQREHSLETSCFKKVSTGQLVKILIAGYLLTNGSIDRVISSHHKPVLPFYLFLSHQCKEMNKE